MNPKYVLLGSLILTVVAWLVDSRNSKVKSPFNSYILALGSNAKNIALTALFSGIALGLGWFFNEGYPGAFPAGLGILFAGLSVIKVHTCSRAYLTEKVSVFPFAMALLCGCISWLLGRNSYEIRMGLIIGATCGAALLAMSSESKKLPAVWHFSISTALINCGLILGAQRGDDRSAVGFALLAAACLVLLTGQAVFETSQKMGIAFAVGIGTVLATWGIAGQFVGIPAAPIASAIGVGCAFLTLWLFGENESQSAGTVALACLIWISAATVAFGQSRGYGMGILVLSGFSVFYCLNHSKGLTLLCLPICLLVYRVFMEEFAGFSRTLEVSQHYSVIGALFGALLPIALTEYGRKLQSDSKNASLFGVGVIGVTGLALITSLFLVGIHGIVGLLIGLTLAPAIACLTGTSNLAIGAICSGLASSIVLIVGFVESRLGIERDVKIRLVIYSAIAILLMLSATQYFLKTDMKKETV